MQLGFVSAILPELELRDVLQTARRLDYECVELMCWPVGKAERRYAGVTHVDVSGITPARADEIRGLASEAGIAISSLGYYPNPLSPHAEEAQQATDHLRQLIVGAHTLGLARVTTFVGRDWTRSVDDNWPRFLSTWRPLIQFAEDHGVSVGIENCPMLFSRDEWPGGKNLAISPKIWRRMFDDIPSANFGLNYDPSHLIWMQMDAIAPLREFAGRLVHVHAKDVRVDRHRLNEVGILAHPAEYHTPKLPGFGDVNWGQFFATLTDVGYRGPVCVEVEDRAYEDSLESRVASLRQSSTYLRNFLPRRTAPA